MSKVTFLLFFCVALANAFSQEFLADVPNLNDFFGPSSILRSRRDTSSTKEFDKCDRDEMDAVQAKINKCIDDANPILVDAISAGQDFKVIFF